MIEEMSLENVILLEIKGKNECNICLNIVEENLNMFNAIIIIILNDMQMMLFKGSPFKSLG